ncbi:MAG: hypothetical protein PVJ67_06175 [Candidatus Pacearchaeota archaeon]|jgi:hypothetical protein
MAEKEKIFSSSVKYAGIFSFKDFYKFCHEYLTEELGFGMGEGKYEEKLAGDAKNIVVEWKGEDKVTDYFQFKISVSFEVNGLKNVEVMEGNKKVKTNEGSIKVKISGTLVRDYQGKFETSGFQKFMRSIYEKWVIPSRIDQFEGKLAGDCDDFLGQAKAYLDLEGKK